MKNKILKISHLERGLARYASASVASGQALVTLLFFVLISLTITSAAIIIIIGNSLSATRSQEGLTAYYAAENGIENGILRLLRDPSYAGETLTVGGVEAVVTVSGGNPKIITSVGKSGNFERTIRAEMNYGNGSYTFRNWKEI